MRINFFLLIHIFLFSNLVFAQENKEDLCNSLVTNDMLECLSIRNIKLDNELNDIYKKLKVELDNNIFNELRIVQRFWLSNYKYSCNILYQDLNESAEQNIYYSLCLNQQIIERSRELSIILNNVNKIENNISLYKSEVNDKNWIIYLNKHCLFMMKYFNDEQCIKRNMSLHQADFG